ncbi:hypothetical protein Cgig2_015618 [Carnegiea gigantea]|uniref:Uncharacterized protein n=1 Tax=Carnegiea gigantea TaxID=171969 RepID=A0A9Q1JJR8_9CARY|nr:hypothetical protein Cgig2_015618 [Carnegiea gigantea]
MDLLKQQSKIEWIKYSDDCTKLFFAKAKQRKLATYVYTLKDAEGMQVEGFDQVGKMMLSFYKNLLGKQFTPRSSIDPAVTKAGLVLSVEQQLALTSEFSPMEIQEALFSIPSTKSPSPDGFNSGFYKTTWSVTGPLVVGGDPALGRPAGRSPPSPAPAARSAEKAAHPGQFSQLGEVAVEVEIADARMVATGFHGGSTVKQLSHPRSLSPDVPPVGGATPSAAEMAHLAGQSKASNPAAGQAQAIPELGGSMETNSHPLNLILPQPPHSVSRFSRAYPLSTPARNAQIVGSITAETSTLAAPILSGATQP